VARTLRKLLPVTLEEITAFANKNEDRLKAIARNAKARGRRAEVLE
jgi:hypothetical protein